jgi:hypothetical protein
MGEMTSFPLWATVALAAVLASVAVVAIFRFGGRAVIGAAAAAVLILGLGLVALDRLDAQDKADQRRAIEARIMALNAQALLPNSNLSCLDAAGGDLVHEACEKSLFAGPEQVTAALNYVGARLDVLREIAALPDPDETAYESLRTPIVRSLEADRFGLVAQVLVARDDCQPAACYAFDILPRRDRIVDNMKARAYDARVTQFAATWNEKAGAQPGAVLASQTGPQSPPHTPVNIDFPTADSIPAVSIMSNEPGRPGQNGVAAAPRSESRQSQSQSQPQSQPQASPAPQTVQAPPPAPPVRRPPQKSQSPRATAPSPAPTPPPPAAADPFPLPVGSAQTTGTQQQ